MKKRVAALRCSDDLLAEIDELCSSNHVTRSTFLNSALRHYLIVMAENGLIAPIENEDQAKTKTHKKPTSPPSSQRQAAYPDEDEDDLGLIAADGDDDIY